MVKAPGDAHALVHGIDLGDEGLGFGFVTALGHEAGKLRKPGKPGIHLFAVILQHDGQNHRVGQAVGRAVKAAQGMGNGMDIAYAGPGEGIARLIGSN